MRKAWASRTAEDKIFQSGWNGGRGGMERGRGGWGRAWREERGGGTCKNDLLAPGRIEALGTSGKMTSSEGSYIASLLAQNSYASLDQFPDRKISTLAH